MRKTLKSHELDRKGAREAALRARILAELAGGLKELYDPVAEAALPLCFGRPLGWLYFVTSDAGASERTILILQSH